MVGCSHERLLRIPILPDAAAWGWKERGKSEKKGKGKEKGRRKNVEKNSNLKIFGDKYKRKFMKLV
jgi:hypothetical protein